MFVCTGVLVLLTITIESNLYIFGAYLFGSADFVTPNCHIGFKYFEFGVLIFFDTLCLLALIILHSSAPYILISRLFIPKKAQSVKTLQCSSHRNSDSS